MPAAVSYIGAVIQVSASTPATVDAAGFAALTYTTVGKVVEWGEVGDTTGDIAIPLLAGRVEHLNDAKDGGEIAWTVAFDTDAGQTILVNGSNSNITHSVKITDPDGKISYFHGLVANVRDRPRTTGNYKGLTGVFRVNTATIRV